MMARRHHPRPRKPDGETLSLLDWLPPEPIARFDELRVRQHSFRRRVSAAVAETLKQSQMSRAEIATAMTQWLGETVSLEMLAKYASTSSEEHAIPLHRAIALCAVTGDARMLATLLDGTGICVMPEALAVWVTVGMAYNKMNELQAYIHQQQLRLRSGKV